MSRVGAAALAFACASSHAHWTLAREFDFARGDTLDPKAWTVEEGFQRNRESQYYSRANVMLQGGVLVIEARREDVVNAGHKPGSRDWRRSAARAAYTSGSIVLREPLQFGRIEVVARSPSGAGVWPAIWLLHEGDDYGEIDLYEAVGKHPDTVFGAVHFGRTAGTRDYRSGSIVVPGFERSWRTHTLEWTPARIAMAVDAKPVFAFDPRQGGDALGRPMFLHLNLALGGSWGGAIDDKVLPARFEIASIRIFKWSADSAAAADAPDASVKWGR